jgi:uncharacterized protein
MTLGLPHPSSRETCMASEPPPGPQPAPTEPPPAGPVIPPRLSVTEERQWGMFAHLASLAGYIIPSGNILGPLVVWLMKRDQSPFVDHHGKESVNFQINVLIYLLISVPLMCVIVGFFIAPIVGVYGIAMAIIGGIKANNGEMYRYPYVFRLVK